MVAVGILLVLYYPQNILPPVLIGIFISSIGLSVLMDQLRGRLIQPAPDYRYRAQELGIIFRGPPR